ncbi:MAG: tRNA N6-adenosine threonylcarbamoyltransferase [Paracoccaceae bacterium]|nr:MAG: tRNA N6-adenosine threonylcarbamoyltransferase [Paracoccaceae bacterium]
MTDGRGAGGEFTVLGIESSCDETAAAVVRGGAPGPGRILADIVFGQAEMHAPFGGVVPEIAARAHAERLDLCVERALAEAGCGLGAIDAIAVTAGPGLIGGVLSGVMFARGLAEATGLPILGINHLAGHALTPRLTHGLAFPYLMLLVSGGHCQFLAVLGPESFRRLGSTIDDAPGEAFDKCARLLGLGYPGGPEVERAAAGGDPGRFDFPRPLLDRPGCEMSFSGLKTALRRARDRCVAEAGGLRRGDLADLAAGFQAAVADVLAAKAARAMAAFAAAHGPGTIAVAGGVAANAAIRAALQDAAAAAGFAFLAPPMRLCTDNGAMIAWAGVERLCAGARGDAAIVARPRWPLDAGAVPVAGSGRKGAKA